MAVTILSRIKSAVNRGKRRVAAYLDTRNEIEDDSYPLDGWVRRRLSTRHAATMHPFLASLFPDGAASVEEVADWVDEAFGAYRARPVPRNVGGTGLHNALWVFVTCRWLRPTLVIESGVFHGQLAYMIRKSVPDADYHGFDIDLGNLSYSNSGAAFHEEDWSGYDGTAAVPDSTLCVFDDHVDQALRVRQAHERGFRHLLFDDAPPVEWLYQFGRPGAPTVPMLFDPSLEAGDTLHWMHRGREYSYTVRAQELSGTRSLIDAYESCPWLGYNHTWLAAVRLAGATGGGRDAGRG